MRPSIFFASVATCLTLVTACAAAVPTPTVPPTSTMAPTQPAAPAPPTAVPISPAAAAPTTAPATPATKPASAASPFLTATSAAAGPAAAPGADARRFTIIPEQSEVSLRVKEQLADLASPSDAVLTTKDVKGQIVVTREGKVIADGSKVSVNLESLKSDRAMRDNFIKRSTLETSRFPTAEFVPTELRGLPSPAPTSGDVKAQLVGNMTVHGTTKPVTFDLESKLDSNIVKGTANTQLKITDFGMPIPRVAVVLSVEDLVQMQVAFTAST